MRQISPALIGKAGELLVAAELMRRGIEVAHPASDVGVDLLAYSLQPGEAVATRFVPIQVKAHSADGYSFQKSWFKHPDLVLVLVWNIQTRPEFYIFAGLKAVEQALGTTYSRSASWAGKGAYRGKLNPGVVKRLRPFSGDAAPSGWDALTTKVLNTE